MSIQIYILGKLAEENSYPYKLKKLLSDPIPIDKFTGISESKLYYHFDKLADKGYIEVVETIKEENRPDKNVYQITNQGREELKKRIYQTFEKAIEINEMYIALSYIKHVKVDKVLAILEQKNEKHRQAWKTYLSFDLDIDEQSEAYWSAKFIQEHAYSRAQHNAEWLEKLIMSIKEKAK